MRHDSGMERAAESDEMPTKSASPPRWMRRGTILTLIAGAIFALGLIGYFLLPGAWAHAIGSMTHGTSAWWHGLGSGVLFTAAPAAAAVGALRLRRHPDRRTVLIVLIAATAVLAAPTVLTLLISTGLTDPLARADVDLRITAPGFTVGTLVGLVLTVVAAGAGRILWTNRARSRETSNAP